MKFLKITTVLAIVCGLFIGSDVLAGDKDPLFVSVTTDDAYRSELAINVAKHMFERGHPLTLFFSDRGILVVSKSNAGAFKTQQATLSELGKGGALLIACPFCMKHYGVSESDLLDGVKVGSTQLTGDALFRDNTKTLVW